MTTQLAQRLGRVGARVGALAERDRFRSVFGSESPVGHEYVLHPPLPEASLGAFESRCGVRLPAAYRAFLSTVADGGAGPSYGLLPFVRAIAGRRSPAAPFPYTTKDARRVMTRRVSGREPYAFAGTGDDAPGIVALCDDGCGWTTYLVVRGEQRGKVWVGGESGWCPEYFLRDGKPVQHTFLSWYEAWLRRTWRETRAKEFTPPSGARFALDGALVGELPAALFACTHIEALSLGSNKLTSVPEAIGRLARLRTLDLGGNRLTSLPDALGELRALEELHVAHNRLDHLPAVLGKLTSLRVLAVQNNPIHELPAAMASLRALRRLALGDTALRQLPTWLHTLGLEQLELNGVHLDDWEALRAFADGGTLKHLWLSRNEALDRIPDAVFAITSLEHLVLGGTAVETIPPAIARLRNLRTIGLANTPLRSLSPELCSLPLLTRVVLQGAPVPEREVARAKRRWPRIDFS
jgi:hypothetical protein